MALPRALLPLVKSPRFWSDYLFLTDAEYPSPYKSAFARIEEDSDSEDGNDSDNEIDESSGSKNENQDGKQEDPTGGEIPHDGENSEEMSSKEPASSEPPPKPDSENKSIEGDHTSSSSASPPLAPRPRSPYYSHTLKFPFQSNRSLESNPKTPASENDEDDDDEDNIFNLSLPTNPSLSYFELTFHIHNLGRGISIAHDDQAHWHPFVLRWEELELICKAVDVNFSAQRSLRLSRVKHTSVAEDEMDMKLRYWEHPGLALLFLYRFAPICVDDDVDRIVSLLVRAWRKVLGDEEAHEKDIRRFIERMDFRRRKFRWFKEEGGNWWIGTGDGDDGEVYTYRSREAVTSGKWRNEEWNKLVEEARAVVDGTGGLGGLNDEDRELAVRFAPRPKQSLNLWLDLREKDRPLHPRAGRYFVLTLDAVLRILDLGRASPSGGSSTIINGQSVWTSDHFSISLYGDLERGKGIIKHMLWWIRAPVATSLRDGATYEKLPFGLADGNENMGTREETYLGICVPDILPNCSWLVGHTLPNSLEDILRSEEVLRCQDQDKGGGHVSGPTKDGWLTITTSDDGELGLNFSRFDGKELEGTGAVALRKTTPQVSGVLHALMKESGAVLTPIGLAARPLSDEVADISWPPHRIVDADTLHGILSGGAFQLWVRAERKADEVHEDDEEDREDRW